MKKILKNIALLLLVGFIVYNSVYFTSVKDMKAKVEGFDATGYAQRFYQNQLVPLSDSAIGVADLITMLKNNKDAAFDQYGHALSIGAIKYFLVKGEGTVTAVNQNTVAIQLPADAGTKLKIATELVFGNAIRDASGKISLTEFSNLSDVNGISMELNKIVRANVLPPFKAAVKEGSKIRFYGAVELNKERLNLDEMEILPIQLQIVSQ